MPQDRRAGAWSAKAKRSGRALRDHRARRCWSLAMVVLLTLIVDFMVDGLARIDVDFLTNFPSRRPGAGRDPLRLGRHQPDVMITTAFLAVPLGVGAGIYLEEYAGKNWLSNIIEINVTNLAGVPSIIYGLLALGLFVQTFGSGQTVLVAGMTLGAADPAHHHRRDARGGPLDSARNPRGRLRARRRQVADDLDVPAAGGAAGHSHRRDRRACRARSARPRRSSPSAR